MPRPETNLLEPGTVPVDGIRLLRADFDEVDAVFARYWDISHADDLRVRATKTDVVRDVCRRTRLYLGLEAAFVRATGGTVSDDKLLHEMHAGQVKALELVAQIERGDPADRQFDPAVRVLGDFLHRHVQGEREGVFHHVTASRLNLFELGDQLRRRRAELLVA